MWLFLPYAAKKEIDSGTLVRENYSWSAPDCYDKRHRNLPKVQLVMDYISMELNYLRQAGALADIAL